MYGLGTVYKKTRLRKDGGQRIFYVAQIRMTIDGEKRRIEGQGRTPQAALHARERAVARALEGTTRTPQQTHRTGTLLALMTEWSATRKVKSRTREHTDSVIKNHIMTSDIKDKPLRSIRSEDIQRLLDSRESDWTKIAVYKAMRSFITYALQNGLITTDPMQKIKKTKPPRAKHANSPAMDERTTRIRGMLGWMRATEWDKENPMYWCRIMLALNGLRPGEARGLTWDSVRDLSSKHGIPRAVIDTQLGYTEGTLTLMPVKNDHPRTVVLRQQTIDALKAWKKVQTGLRRRKTWKPRKGFEDMVCVMNDGKPLRQQDDDKMWNDLLDTAQKNYKKKIYWTMAYNRHIAVSLMRDAGVPASLVASIMGHTIAVEDAHYYQSQLSAQRDAMATMDDYIVEHTTPKSEKA
jgi:integrase